MANENETKVEKVPGKRGRKPSEKRKGYFYEEEEAAFSKYINSESKSERDIIFRDKLYPAFTKMVESIIRTYNLYVPSEDYEETFCDTMSYLLTKLDKFDPTKGYKVYSYCGTICKNYLIFKRNQYKKNRDKNISYDMLFPTADKDTRIESNDEKEIMSFNNELIERTISEIKIMLSPENIVHLNNTEQKIGYALLEMLTHWEDIFKRLENKKFNKTSVWYFLKEYTLLSSNEIRDGMKKYKNLYFFTKEKMIND